MTTDASLDLLRDLFSPTSDFLTMMSAGLRGLTDAEYLWEPVADCWSVRPREDQRTEPDTYLPEGAWGLDIHYPDPKPSPFTTIAWRMTHLTGSMYIAAALLRGQRTAAGHIDNVWPRHRSVPVTADEAVSRWEDALGELRRGLATATASDMTRIETHDWATDEATLANAPVWRQVVYFGYFEPASHGAEVRLLRDLHRHTGGRI